MRNNLILIAAILTVMLSCRSDANRRLSYIYFSINGPTINGEFRIEEDMDPSFLEVTSIVTPAFEEEPAVAFLTYHDYAASIDVALQIPPEELLLLLTEDYPFTMGISFGQLEVSLIAKEVSIHITKFKSHTGAFQLSTVKEMVANFEGTMTYENPDLVIEVHTIKGDMVFSG